MRAMEAHAEIAPEVELTAESWSAAFDKDNSIDTPIGRVKMGDGQITKFFEKNRTKELGMVQPTLQNPDVIFAEKSAVKDGNAERDSSYVFVKTFERNGLQELITHRPELLDNLQGVLRSMTVVEKEDGYISLENETHQATLMTLFGYPNRNELFLTEFKKKLSDEEIRYRDGENSDDEIGVREVAKVREQLEARLATNAYQVREAFQDSMLSLKEFMLETLREEGRGVDHIKEVADFENAYVAENRLSSASKAQWDEYEAKHIRPLLKAVTDLCGESKSARQELENYMLAKHGLERQELMEKRDAASKALSKVGDRPIAPKQDIPNYEVLFAQWQLADAEWEEMYDRAYEMTLDKSMERDFAGLTGLTKTERVEDAKWLAQEIVSDYESRYGADIDALWIAVRGASRAQLEALRHGGVLTREEMEYIDGMYEYYIPMRGFRDGTSRDEYGYIGRDSAGNGTTMKGARGRKSVADDPIATIAEMAERSFSEAGRNKMKQRFLNFIENHPSDLIGTSDLWLQYDAGIDEWRAVRYPERDGGESAEEYAGRVVAFVNSLETRSKTDKSLKRSDDVMEQPYRVLQGDLGEHQVLVKRGGKRVVITLYGNPRVAQAVNGLTNPDVPTQGSVSKVTNAFRSVMRYLSAVYTSYSPNFVLRNWQRDFIYASTILGVKEGVDYAKRFQANKGFVMDAAKVFGLLKKWEHGELDESDAVDREFSLFMRNGGETGYIAHNDLEWHKNHVERLLKSLGQQNRLKGVLDVYERLNRSIECGTRFAVYLTSREMGRSVERSVFDAKESTVNFNKKGSGAKMMGMEGQTFIGNCAALVSDWLRTFQLFVNPAIQGTTNVMSAGKHHPKRFLGMASVLFGLGFMQAVIMNALGGDDDDDEQYWLKAVFDRRSHLYLFGDDGKFLSVVLPHEFIPIFGMGELLGSMLVGKGAPLDTHDAAWQLAQLLCGVLPVNPIEGMQEFDVMQSLGKVVIPSVLEGEVDIANNEAWYGAPIYRESPFNKDAPEWEKAFRQEGVMWELAKGMEGATRSAGDKHGWINLNPSTWEYRMKHYLGGPFDFVSDASKLVFSEEEVSVSEAPFVKTIYSEMNTERAMRSLRKPYFKMRERAEWLTQEGKNAAKEKDQAEYVLQYGEQQGLKLTVDEARLQRERAEERLNALNGLDDYKKAARFVVVNKELEGVVKARKAEADPEKLKALEKREFQLMKQALEDWRSE